MPKVKKGGRSAEEKKGFTFDVPEDDAINAMGSDDEPAEEEASRRRLLKKAAPRQKKRGLDADLEAALDRAMEEAAEDMDEDDADVVAEEGPGLPDDLLAALGTEFVVDMRITVVMCACVHACVFFSCCHFCCLTGLLGRTRRRSSSGRKKQRQSGARSSP